MYTIFRNLLFLRKKFKTNYVMKYFNFMITKSKFCLKTIFLFVFITAIYSSAF